MYRLLPISAVPRIVITFLVACLPGTASAQKSRSFNFSHYNTTNGLVSNQVSTVVQDQEGFIWTGTTDGLQRFDGTRYKTFSNRPGDMYSLPSNPVQKILLDKNQNLWVLLADGKVGIFDRQKFTYKVMKVAVATGALAAANKNLVADEFGNIFLVVQGHALLAWNPGKMEFSARHSFIKLPASWKVADMVQQPRTQKYWISFGNGGLAVFNRLTGNLSYKGHNIEQEAAVERLAGQRLYHLFFDKRGRVWFITWGNSGYPFLSCYYPPLDQFIIDKKEFTYLQTYYELQGFFEQQDGTIWVRGMGVFARFLEKEKEFEMVANGYRHERSIVYELVSALLEDREKNIWVGTNNNGLYRFNPAKEYFTNVKHVNRVTGKEGKGSVMSIMPTQWGTILVGTWADGLYHLDRDLNYIPVNIKGIDNSGGPAAWSMFASRDSNTIWLSAQPGIYRIDQARRSAKYYNPPVLDNKTVRQVAEDKNGHLWLGMQGIGVFKWSFNKGQPHEDSVKRFDAVPPVQVNKILVDSKGYVWIATASNGVYVIDPSTDKVIWQIGGAGPNGNKLPEPAVSSLLEYSDSIMIITTATHVVKLNRHAKQFSIIGRPGFISGYIASVEKDASGFLWLATTSGLYRVNLQKNIFVGFNRGDGINNDNFVLAASGRIPGGRLMFGSSDQLIAFNPASIHLAPPVAEVKITDFKVMNQSLGVDSLMQLKEVELGYKQNSVVIGFSTLNFTSGSLIRYRLSPIDKEWRTADKNNEAIYSYLPPGKYRFSMLTIDEDGNESARGKDLSIVVKPPFWKTGWFVAILVLAGGGLLYRWDRERMQRKETIHRMRVSIARNLHQEVNTALSNINILSEMARLKADTEPQKSKEFIEQIHNKSHHMMIAMDDMLWSLEPDNDSMQKTVARMQEYIDALNSRHAANISMIVDERVNNLKLDMQFRHEAFILFKESISMLVRACATNCKIKLGLDKGLLLYTLRFNNESCEMQELNNLLQSRDLGERLNAIKATLSVHVHKSHSELTLKVPVT